MAWVDGHAWAGQAGACRGHCRQRLHLGLAPDTGCLQEAVHCTPGFPAARSPGADLLPTSVLTALSSDHLVGPLQELGADQPGVLHERHPAAPADLAPGPGPGDPPRHGRGPRARLLRRLPAHRAAPGEAPCWAQRSMAAPCCLPGLAGQASWQCERCGLGLASSWTRFTSATASPTSCTTCCARRGAQQGAACTCPAVCRTAGVWGLPLGTSNKRHCVADLLRRVSPAASSPTRAGSHAAGHPLAPGVPTHPVPARPEAA